MDRGIVLVSHSKDIAVGIAQLIDEVAKDVSVTIAGGTDEGAIGTSFEKILAAIETNEATKILAFFDLGSARMNLEMASEITEKEVTLFTVPVVEGTYTAAALLQAGATFEEIQKQLDEMILKK